MLGYSTHIDSKEKKHQEVAKIIREANSSIQQIRFNPNNQSVLSANNVSK